MKIVHISDIHIDQEPILGHDPVMNFRACLAHVKKHQSDAAYVVITGDLTHRGRPDSYALLQELLAEAALPAHMAPRLLIGNHDDRDNFLAAFPESPRDPDGFVQWIEETPVGLFVYMDSVEAGMDEGSYDSKRRHWLETVLEQARATGSPAWLFLHHNPCRVYVANADLIGIRQNEAFRTLLTQNRDVIRHIFFGHCHFTLSGTVAGIPFSAPRSTNHACWPDFSGDAMRMGHGDLTPDYNVCFLDGDDVVIHSIDFLDDGKVLWAIEDGAGAGIAPV